MKESSRKEQKYVKTEDRINSQLEMVIRTRQTEKEGKIRGIDQGKET